MSVYLGTSDPVQGLSFLPSISFPLEPDADLSMYNGDIKIKPFELYKPPPRTLKVHAMPFVGINERGLPMGEPVGATYLNSTYAPFKQADMLTDLYVAEPLPTESAPPSLAKAFNAEQRRGTRL